MRAAGFELPIALGVLFAILALMTLFLGAMVVSVVRARARGWDESALITAVLMTAVITASALLLGATHMLTLPAWLALLFAAGVAMFHFGRARAGEPPAGEELKLQPPSAWFAAASGGLALAQMVFVTRNPPADRDSLAYHLPMAAHWFMTHALGAPLRVPPESATYYPGNLELLQLLAIWPGRNDLYVGLVNVACLWLLTLGVRRLALSLGAQASHAEGGALLVATMPVCALLVKGLSADAAMAAFVVAALVFLLRWRAEGGAMPMTLALLALGWIAGCRFTGPAYAALLLALAWLLPGRSRDARLAPWWAFAAALALGGFWMARNAIAIGNPFYPAETQVLGHVLPGTLPLAMLRRTTQLAAWREGFAGHLTFANLWAQYRAGLLLLAATAVVAILPRARQSVREAGMPLLFAAAAFALFLVSFYSGVNLPSQHGEPPMLASGNVRYLLPAIAALCALGAALLGSVVPARTALALLAIACLAQMAPMWSRIGIALVAAAVFFAADRLRERRPRLGEFVGNIMVALVLIGAPSHARLEARIWDSYADRVPLLPSALVDSLRTEARGRVIAMTGLEGSWEVVGSRLEGRPAYVPVARTWKQARSMWDFTPDDRARASQATWRANLRASGAAFVAIGWSDTSAAPIESLWCASDTASFALRATRPGRAVYRVR